MHVLYVSHQALVTFMFWMFHVIFSIRPLTLRTNIVYNHEREEGEVERIMSHMYCIMHMYTIVEWNLSLVVQVCVGLPYAKNCWLCVYYCSYVPWDTCFKCVSIRTIKRYMACQYRKTSTTTIDNDLTLYTTQQRSGNKYCVCNAINFPFAAKWPLMPKS